LVKFDQHVIQTDALQVAIMVDGTGHVNGCIAKTKRGLRPFCYIEQTVQ